MRNNLQFLPEGSQRNIWTIIIDIGVSVPLGMDVPKVPKFVTGWGGPLITFWESPKKYIDYDKGNKGLGSLMIERTKFS